LFKKVVFHHIHSLKFLNGSTLDDDDEATQEMTLEKPETSNKQSQIPRIDFNYFKKLHPEAPCFRVTFSAWPPIENLKKKAESEVDNPEGNKRRKLDGDNTQTKENNNPKVETEAGQSNTQNSSRPRGTVGPRNIYDSLEMDDDDDDESYSTDDSNFASEEHHFD